MIGITDPAKKRGLFGKPAEYYGTPPIHNPMQHTPEMRQAAQPAPQPGGKNPSVLPYALAGLQDFVALRMGYRPQGVATLNAQTAQQQQAAADAAAAQRKRAQELADYEYKKGIDQKYAKPDTYRWRSNSGDLMEMGPDGQPRVAYDDPTDKIQWVRAENGDGTFTMVPVGANGPVGGGGPLPEFTEDDWNGAGGGTGNGVGGF